MTRMLLVIAAIGGLCITISFFWIVLLNWGPVVRATTFSAVLGGLTTVLVAVLSGLKETSVEDTFSINILFDNGNMLPVILADNQPYQIGIIAQKWFQSENLNRTLLPQSPDDIFLFVAEILQFKILDDLRKIGLETVTSTSSGEYSTTAGTLKRSSDSVKLPFKKVVSKCNNRFYDVESKINYPSTFGIPVPKDTSIELSMTPGSIESGGRKHIVILQKDHFFSINFIIEEFALSGQDAPPSVRKVSFTIRMKAVFDWVSAGSHKTIEYQEWAKWIFAEIKKIWTSQ